MSNSRPLRHRPTLHDLTSLRLHASTGRRAHKREAEALPRRDGMPRVWVDGRGNVQASDAVDGGVVRAGKRRKVMKEGEEESEGIDDVGRASRVDDIEFPVATPALKPPPSSDLLKCIHHFACKHYASTGELYHAGLEARRERKVRRIARLQGGGGDEEGRPTSSQQEGHDGGDDDDDGDEGSSGGDGEDEQVKVQKANEGKRAKEKELVRTMYRCMDGSALMVIGMLLQEHVAALVTGGDVEMESLTGGSVPDGEPRGEVEDDKQEEDSS